MEDSPWSENKRSFSESALVPGHRDMSMYPAPSRLGFNTIAVMNEQDMDSRFSQHLRGESPFKDPELYKNEEERRIFTKRVLLFILEGGNYGGKAFANWFNRARYSEPPVGDPGNVASAMMARLASDKYKERMREVRYDIAPKMNLLVPDSLTKMLFADIQEQLKQQKLPKIELENFFKRRPQNLDDKSSRTRKTNVWGVHDLLLFYLRLLQNPKKTDSQIGEEFGYGLGNTVDITRNRHFSDETIRILNIARTAARRLPSASKDQGETAL